MENEGVLMEFPREVRLTVHGGRTVHFPRGIQLVPVEFADHDWLKQNGVTRCEVDPGIPKHHTVSEAEQKNAAMARLLASEQKSAR